MMKKLCIKKSDKVKKRTLRVFGVGDSCNRWGSKWIVVKRTHGKKPDAILWENKCYAGGDMDTFRTYSYWTVAKLKTVAKERVWPTGQVTLAGSEMLPSDSDYGRSAWNYQSRELAEKKYQELSG